MDASLYTLHRTQYFTGTPLILLQMISVSVGIIFCCFVSDSLASIRASYNAHYAAINEYMSLQSEESSTHSRSTFVPPSPFDKAATARWLTHNTVWGSLSTISSRERQGKPFGNISSFSDGAPGDSTGEIYFLHSPLDASMIDIMHDDSVSLSISEMQTGYCQGEKYDAEDPRCARLSLSGRIVKVSIPDEIVIARHALFTKHPSMKEWYYGDEEHSHDFGFWKIELEEIWLVDFFGGAALISLDAWNRGTDIDGVLTLLPSSISGLNIELTEKENNIRCTVCFFASLIGAFTVGFLLGGHRASLHQSFTKM